VKYSRKQLVVHTALATQVCIALVSSGCTLYWEGYADLVFLVSVPTGMLAFISLLVAPGIDPSEGFSIKNPLCIWSAFLLLTIIGANVIGIPLREAGLKDRMKWGEQMAVLIRSRLLHPSRR
jgi:hypothetical protein